MRILTRLLPLLALLLLAAPVHAAVNPDVAEQDLEQFKSFVRNKRASNDDLTVYMGQVANAYNNFEKPEKPADDAPEEELKAWQAEMKKLEKAQESFNKEAEKLLFKALTLTQIDKTTEDNEREPVNIKAAELIGGLGANMDERERGKVSSKVIKVIEKLDKPKYEVKSDFIEALFATLGKLNDVDSLEWMADEFAHTNNDDDSVVRLIAAHKAMVLFTDVPGALRYDITEEFTKTYSSVELQAQQSSTDKNVQAKKAFWDRIRVDAIRVVQFMAKEPTDAEGQAYNSMGDLYYWFKENDNKRKAPWKEEKEKE